MAALTIADLDNGKLDLDTIAAVATSPSLTTTDRLGHVKRTLTGATAAISAIVDRGAWAPATAYLAKDVVLQSGTWYITLVPHTSAATFATDLATKWRVFQGVTAAELSDDAGAEIVGFTETGADAASGRSIADKLAERPHTTGYVTSTGHNGDQINSAVNDLPSTGGTLYIPKGLNEISTSILDMGKKVTFCFDTGAIVKPVSDLDAFRLTGLGTKMVGMPLIDGSDIVSGVHHGIVVGWGGANAQQVEIDADIRNFPGWGLKWEQGPFLRTNVQIYNCGAGGLVITENYNDTNHGDITLHAVNCGGPGLRTVYTVVVANRARANNFRNVKAFGCGGGGAGGAGGINIQTEQNWGVLFAELNDGPQIRLETGAWGNFFTITGANGESDVIEDLPGANFLSGPAGGGFDFATIRTIVGQMIKLRDRTNLGSLTMAMTGNNLATISNEDNGSNDFEMLIQNKDYPTKNTTVSVDRLKFSRGSGAIDGMATSLVNFAFGTLSANSSSTVTSGLVPGLGSTVALTWADTALNKPQGLDLCAVIDKTSGALSVEARNNTGSSIAVGTVRLRVVTMTHF